MATDKESARFYFAGFRVGNVARLWSALMLAFSLTMAVVVGTWLGAVILGLLALIAAYGLIRPAQRDFFVEAGERHVEIKVLSSNKIRYKEISAIEFYQFKHGEVLRTLDNFGVAFNHFFGGQLPKVGARGEIDRSRLELKFTKRIWIHVPLPPFRIPKRTSILLPLTIDDAESLRLKISEKLRPASPPK